MENQFCDLCVEQVKKGRLDEPHQYLKPVGKARTSNTSMWGAAETTQDYICSKCGAKLIHSDDKYDQGWFGPYTSPNKAAT